MRFLLEPGDAAVVRPCAPEEPRPGDLALLVKWAGGLPSGYVLHRVLVNSATGGRRLLLTKGDANFLPDWPPSAYEPAGLAVALERGGLRYPLGRRLPAAVFLALYGAAANKLLYLAAACAAALYAAARHLLPSWTLNPLYLGWEAGLYPALLRLAARPARLRGGVPAAGACAVKSGRITADETWSGRVVVADYLTIAAGARVTALPGTEIVFERREPWFFPVLRAGLDGEARALESAGAKLLVYGEFHAAGTAAAPVTAGGPAFSGIYALGGGRLNLSHARLSGSAACAFSGRDDASVLAQGCAVSGGARGAEFYGAAGATLEDCSFTGLAGPSLLAGDHAVLLVRGGRADRCGGAAAGLSGQAAAGFLNFSASGCARSDGGAALNVAGGGTLSASGCVFSGNHEGAGLSGKARAGFYRCRFENNAGSPLRLAGMAGAAAEGCSFTGNGSGVSLAGRTAGRAAGCTFSGNAGPSFELSDSARLFAFSCRSGGTQAALAAGGSASASLERFSADSAAAPAVSLAGRASLRAAVSSFASSADAVYARGSASLGLRACVLRAGEGAALDLGCRSAELRGVQASGAGGLLTSGAAAVRARDLQITARDYAAALSGRSFYAEGLRVSGGAKGGLRAAAGRVTLRGAGIGGAPYPGLEAAPGARLEAADVFVDGERWAPPAVRPAPSRARALLFRFAAATYGLAPLAWLYRLYYLAGARAAAALLRPGPGGSLYLYRGMAAGGWVAGLSDMDLALLGAPAAPAADWAAWSALRRRLRLFRALFPFTGEVLSAPADHFLAFMSAWGVKGAEFSAASRLLSGPGIKPQVPRGAGAADLTEAFYAYTLLLTHFYAPGLPPAFRGRNCQKGMVDVRRYLDAASPWRGSRRDYARSMGADLAAPGDPGDAAFMAFAALHSACPAATGTAAAAPPENPVWFNTGVFETACSALAGAAAPGTGVVLDSLYRVYVLLPDALAGDKAAFLKAAAAYGEARRGTHYFSAAPLLISRSSFLALTGLPYLNNPLFWRDLQVPAAGSSPEDGGVFLYAAPRPEAPDKDAAAAAARLAAVHFSASWRSLWGTMPAHYFYTRAAGLRLLLGAGAAPAFSRPHELGEAYRAAFGCGPSWTDFRGGGACGANYEFVAAQTAAMMESA